MKADLPYKFYIVFTPETVRVLYLFLLSLYDRTNFRMHLVVNGCESGEISLLEGFAKMYPERTELTVYSNELRRHPEVIDHLQLKHEDHIFAFMDSDILVGEGLVEYLQHKMSNSDGFFAGPPIWMPSAELPQGRDKAGGRFMITEDGYCLGGTYFATYRNEAVHDIRNRYGVGFSFKWWKDLPRSIRKVLKSEGQKYVRYDNGKVMNILMQHHGYICRFENTPEVQHFGGLSRLHSVLKKDENKLERHSSSRVEQADMRVLGIFMAEALICIAKGLDIPAYKSEIVTGHFSYPRIVQMLESLIELRDKHKGELSKIGL